MKKSRPSHLARPLTISVVLVLELVAVCLLVVDTSFQPVAILLNVGIVLYGFWWALFKEDPEPKDGSPLQPWKTHDDPVAWTQAQRSPSVPGRLKNGMTLKEFGDKLAQEMADNLNYWATKDPAPKPPSPHPAPVPLTPAPPTQAPPSVPSDPLPLKNGMTLNEYGDRAAQDAVNRLNDAVKRDQVSPDAPAKPRAWVVKRIRKMARRLPEVAAGDQTTGACVEEDEPGSSLLDRWGLMAKRQWKQEAPKLYAALEADGTLREHLFSAQESAKASMALMVGRGIDESEAEEQAEKELFRYDPEYDPEKLEDWERELGEQNELDAMEALLKSRPSNEPTSKK